jgi:hypothetical protein
MAAEFSAVAHAMEASLATGRTIEGSALDGASLAASLVTTGRFADPFGYPSGLTAHVGMLTPRSLRANVGNPREFTIRELAELIIRNDRYEVRASF